MSKRKKGLFRNGSFIIVLGVFILCGVALAQEPGSKKSYPPRLDRKDCFLGIHCDFHAKRADKNIGINTTRKMIEDLLDIAKIDYLQIDTKGHYGISSYPTKVGNHGGSFVGDPLRLWREVTAERGIALYAHHSGVIDTEAGKLHPDWAVLTRDGKPMVNSPSWGMNLMSLVGPYADRLLIPQTLELARDYDFDGIWYDGDCWGYRCDWSPAACDQFTKKTGISTIPRNNKDPHWSEWISFQRQLFRDYLTRNCTVIHKEFPNFRICSNWAFGPNMPESPGCGVDFLSGDISPTNSINHCRYISRLFASQEIPWDIMSWCTCVSIALSRNDPDKNAKTAIQLSREAASVIAQGGGYQVDFQQVPKGNPYLRDGSIDVNKVRRFAEIAKFCRDRQEVSFKATPIPQIAVLFSTEGHYKKIQGDSLFPGDQWQYGLVSSLLEKQNAVSVLVSQKLAKRIDEFPLVVIYGWKYIEPNLYDRITDYVNKGGAVLLIGSDPAKIFQKELDSSSQKVNIQVSQGKSFAIYTVGKGKFGHVGQMKIDSELLETAVRKLFPNPIVTTTGTHDVDISVMRTVKGDMAIHFVNTSGPHATAPIIDKIDPVGPVHVKIRLAKKPRNIILEPGKRSVDWKYADGFASLTIASVPLHEIAVVME